MPWRRERRCRHQQSQQAGRKRWNKHVRAKKLTHSINLTLKDGDEVGDGGEGARGGRPLAKALGGRTHSNQYTLGYDVAARRIAAL